MTAMQGRLLGVDYGTVRIGLAISDPDQIVSSPLAVYARRTLERDATFFVELVREERVSGIVVGIPVHLDDFEGEQAQVVRSFGEWLASVTGLPVDYQDERYTSVDAETILRGARLTHKRRKERRDKIAAHLILTAYMERVANVCVRVRQ
ncbi:MAG: Holliday junction resolvase RuvX [Thermoguttaceae bacterium]